MWTYLMSWTLGSIVLAPIVGRMLSRHHGHPAPHLVSSRANP